MPTLDVAGPTIFTVLREQLDLNRAAFGELVEGESGNQGGDEMKFVQTKLRHLYGD